MSGAMVAVFAIMYYLGIGGAAIALVIAVSRARSAGAPAGAYPAPPVDPLEAAFLAGGPGRVADTVLTAMHADGRLAVAGPGVVGVRQAVARHPVESAVLAAHAAAPSGALHWLRIGVMRSPAVQALGDGLAQRGLIVRPGTHLPLRHWSIGLTIASFLSLPVAVVLTAMQFSGFDDRPELPLIVMVVPVVFAGVIVGMVCAGQASARLTGAGRAALQQFRALAHPTDPVHLVTCHGPRAVPDPLLRDQLTTASRIRANSPAARASTGGAGVVVAAESPVTWCGGGGSGCGGSSCGGGGGSSSCGGSSGGGGSSCGGSSGGGSSCGGGGGGGGCGGGGG